MPGPAGRKAGYLLVGVYGVVRDCVAPGAPGVTGCGVMRLSGGTPGMPPLTKRGLASAAAAERTAGRKSVPINEIDQNASDELPLVGG